MKLEQVVNAEEIEVARKPSEFLCWMDNLFERIHSQDEDDKELESQLHKRTGIAKQLYEEVVPLAPLLRQKKETWDGVLVRNVLGNQPYDVEILKNGHELPSVPDRLEITYVISGRDYKLRIDHLLEHGWTSMTGPVIERQVGRQRVIDLESEAKLAEDTIEEVSNLTRQAIEKKLQKGYRKGTGLVIYVEDYGTFRKAKNLDRLAAVVNDYLLQLKDSFVATYLILSSNGNIVEW